MMIRTLNTTAEPAASLWDIPKKISFRFVPLVSQTQLTRHGALTIG